MSFRQVVPRPAGAARLEVPRARFVSAGGLGPLERAFAAEPPVGPGVPEEEPRPGAAVLLPVFGDRLVMIRRAVHLRSNPGEIAFAGGRLEPGESPEEAALREAFEEIALAPEAVRVVARLPRVYRVTRAEGIAPFVGAVEGSPELAANPAEVDGIIVRAIAELARPERYYEEIWPMPDGSERLMHFFELDGDLLWGASAAILTLFLDRLAAVS